jgi:leader peptidase (prepilin peptidase)/N-methyltransferase
VGAPNGFWAVVAFIAGGMIGSFLNMAIWRLPRRKNESVLWTLTNPSRSYCPKCNKPLSVLDNIPLISFLALRAKCRQCKAPIAWRYFWVEVLTGLVFLALTLHFGPTSTSIVYCLFFAALIAALFIDLEHFIIPDELNTFALVIGIAYDIWGIIQHNPANALMWGWLPHSIFGAILCAGVFVFIQILGFALFKKEAMGDGDVKLARAIGSLLPISQALVSFLLAIGVGAVFGAALMAFATVQSSKASGVELDVQELEEDGEGVPSALGDIALRGLCYMGFIDILFSIGAALKIPAAVKFAASTAEETLEDEDDFQAGPTHIPFGPYMVVGAFLAVFFADSLIAWYLHWAHLA